MQRSTRASWFDRRLEERVENPRHFPAVARLQPNRSAISTLDNPSAAATRSCTATPGPAPTTAAVPTAAAPHDPQRPTPPPKPADLVPPPSPPIVTDDRILDPNTSQLADFRLTTLVARMVAEDEGAYLIEDSLDPATCEGAGTIGLELLERPSRLDTLVIALGGGALASGVGHVAKSLAPDVEVVAVQPERAPAMALSWRNGSVVQTDTIDTIADGVAGRCPIPEVLDDLLAVVDDVLLVAEDSIKTGMRLLHRHAGVVAEPSAALGVAAVLENPERFAGRRAATIICGSNVATDDFERWVLRPPG